MKYLAIILLATIMLSCNNSIKQMDSSQTSVKEQRQYQKLDTMALHYLVFTKDDYVEVIDRNEKIKLYVLAEKGRSDVGFYIICVAFFMLGVVGVLFRNPKNRKADIN